MRAALPALLATVAAIGVATSARGDAGPPPSIRFLREAIANTDKALDRLGAEALKDPRLAKVEKYLSWTLPEDFRNPRRDVTVKDLFGWMVDEAAPMELRETAKKALMSVPQRMNDPDLEYSGSGRSKRAAFSRSSLVPLLTSKASEFIRMAAAELLDSYWKPNDSDIKRYNPRDDKTWGPARTAWNKFLAGK